MFQNVKIPKRTDDQSYIVVDIGDEVQILKSMGDFHESVMESWLARVYGKYHSVACISASLFDKPDQQNLYERMQLSVCATTAKLNPADFLPHPEDSWKDEYGVWFYVKGNYLAMGNSRAIEKCWRHLRH
jgi:hypothetical protein